jgi:alkanesulfonate monooxygenase SsuD/methylene tetrahydromethanopterin reductase-like flavin-dependent oxidoreductase (luciferase family)
MSKATKIEAGVGVVPLDRRPAAEIASAIRDVDPGRLVVGLGAGFSQKPLRDVRAGIAELARLAPGQEIGVAAMGPQMCRLAGELADVVLLNWMTPERARWARERVEEGAEGRSIQPRVASYVRVAAGPDAQRRLADAEGHYRQLPHYARHFEAMGAAPGTIGISRDHSAAIREYESVLDVVIIRPVGDNVDEILKLMATRASP